MSIVLLFISLLAALLLTGFFSGAETGIYSLNRVRLHVASEQGRPGARRLATLMQRPEDTVITMLLGTNIADYLVTACISALLLRAAVSHHWAEAYATAIATPLVLVFGGVIPKDWFRREADRLMYVVALAISVCVTAVRATGLTWLMHRLTHGLMHWIDPQSATREEELLPRARTLRLLREGAAGGALTVMQRDLMERVMNISKTRVGSVMIPREKMAAAPVNLPRDEFLRIVRMAHLSRFPLYEGQSRRIVGIVNAYDVLTDARRQPIAAHRRDALRLSPSMSVSAALLRMQQTRQAMAIVEDARGNCLGILTVKDLAEEIIGDVEAW